MICTFKIHLQLLIESAMSTVVSVACVNKVNVVADISAIEKVSDAGET